IPEPTDLSVRLLRNDLMQVNGFIEPHECLADDLPGCLIRRHRRFQSRTDLELTDLYTVFFQRIDHVPMVFIAQGKMTNVVAEPNVALNRFFRFGSSYA